MGVFGLFILSKYSPAVIFASYLTICDGSNTANSGGQDGFWTDISDSAYCTLLPTVHWVPLWSSWQLLNTTQVYNTIDSWRILSTSLPLLSSHSGSSTFSARLEADAFCGFSINPRTARPTATPFSPPRTKLFVPSQRSLCEHFHFHLNHCVVLRWENALMRPKNYVRKLVLIPMWCIFTKAENDSVCSSDLVFVSFIVSKPGAGCWVVEAAAPLSTLTVPIIASGTSYQPAPAPAGGWHQENTLFVTIVHYTTLVNMMICSSE